MRQWLHRCKKCLLYRLSPWLVESPADGSKSFQEPQGGPVWRVTTLGFGRLQLKPMRNLSTTKVSSPMLGRTPSWLVHVGMRRCGVVSQSTGCPTLDLT